MEEATGVEPEGSAAAAAGALGLTPESYAQLKQIARVRLRHQRPGMTLDCTALVHEAYLKLNGSDQFRKGGQADAPESDHFLAVASMAMRQILVDHARRKRAEKRGGGALHVTLQEARMGEEERVVDLLDLDDALGQLGQRDPGLEQLVVLRFFAGLSMRQAAATMGRPLRTIERDWTRARVYLFQALGPDAT